MVRGALIALGVLSWVAGLTILAIGVTRAERLDRRDFRYDVDMRTARMRVLRHSVSAFAWLVAVGIMFVVCGNL